MGRAYSQDLRNRVIDAVVKEGKPHAKQLFMGEALSLDKTTQTSVRNWICLSAIMIENNLRDIDAKIVTQLERDYFREHLAPPENWFVGIGYDSGIYHSDRLDPMWLIRVSGKSQEQSLDLEMQCITYGIEKLVVHVVSFYGPAQLVSSILSRYQPPNIYPIWPMVRKAIHWPPSEPWQQRIEIGFITQLPFLRLYEATRNGED